STRVRIGQWCPVYVTLKAGKEPITRDTYRLVVKTIDADDTPFRYSVAVPALNAEDSVDLIAYTRPGPNTSDFDVQLVSLSDGRVVQNVTMKRDGAKIGFVESKDSLLLAIGSRTLRPDAASQKAEDPDPEITERNLAYIDGDSVGRLPDQWFGYDAVDV